MSAVQPAVNEAVIMAALAILTPREVMGLLSQEVLDQLAAPDMATPAPIAMAHPGTPEQNDQIVEQGSPAIVETEKRKRVLNSYLAFRTYYSAMLRIQQKEVSAFTTVLWQNEHFRDRWTLIAKVYSFVRDEVGIKNCPLKPFLRVACPIMKIVAPEAYIGVYFWSISPDNHLVQDREAAIQAAANIAQEGGAPTTELELLSACVPDAFSPEYAPNVLAKMRIKSTGLMTISSLGNGDKTAKFISAILNDPIGQAGTILGVPADDDFFQLGVSVFQVTDSNTTAANITTHGPTTAYPIVQPAVLQAYPYEQNEFGDLGSENLDLNLEAFGDNVIDIDNPYHVDGMIEHQAAANTSIIAVAELGLDYDVDMAYQMGDF